MRPIVQRVLTAFAFFVAVAMPTQEVAADPITFSAAGVNVAAVTPTVDAFRTALGTLNPNVAGSFGSGRREINWDGVPDSFAAPNSLPANFFNVNSPRGVVLSTPGTGFQVSAKAAWRRRPSSATSTRFTPQTLSHSVHKDCSRRLVRIL